MGCFRPPVPTHLGSPCSIFGTRFCTFLVTFFNDFDCHKGKPIGFGINGQKIEKRKSAFSAMGFLFLGRCVDTFYPEKVTKKVLKR